MAELKLTLLPRSWSDLAGPKARHVSKGDGVDLDLVYLTDRIILVSLTAFGRAQEQAESADSELTSLCLARVAYRWAVSAASFPSRGKDMY
jgi:hypothetical protein